MAQTQLDQGQRDLLNDMVAAVDRGEPERVRPGQLKAWARALPHGSSDLQRINILLDRLPKPAPKPEVPVDPEAGRRGRARAEARNEAGRKEIERAEQVRKFNDPWNRG